MNAAGFAALLAASFLLGALPFSVWIGRYWLGVDIRSVGDRNPGATNVLRAGSRSAAAIALLLDALKATVLAATAWFGLHMTGLPLALIAVAPIAGHAWSPFLGWRGGKAVAATFGAWAGLTLWVGPTVLGLALLMTTRRLRPAWAVLSAMLILFPALILIPTVAYGLAARPALPALLATWLLNCAILIIKHRPELTRPLSRPRVIDTEGAQQ